MNPEDIKAHWKDWSSRPGCHATTMSETAKQLEVEALYRRLKNMPTEMRVLEAGCGNGINCIELAKRLPTFLFDGFDYIQEMINAAQASAEELLSELQFGVGDVLKMEDIEWLDDEYDVVITDRCIINLDTWDKQKQAIAALADKVNPGGWLLMIENCKQRRELQSKMCELLGLPPRGFPPFNLFLDEDKIFSHIQDVGLHLVEWEHFGSLHDLCLYVLAPAMESGLRDYGHPLVKIATELSLKMPGAHFGAFGQNTLFVCRKPA